MRVGHLGVQSPIANPHSRSSKTETQTTDQPERRRPEVQVNYLIAWLTRVFLLVLFLATNICIGQSGGTADKKSAEGELKRPFTVSDSIQMTHVVDPSEHGTGYTGKHPKASPNGSCFLLVTERGILETNVREYTLFVYEQLNGVLKTPTRVVTFSSSSNRPGISQAKWVDNETISLLGENPGELPQVFLVHWRNGKAEKITSHPAGVAAYDLSLDGKTVVYYAFWQGDAAEIKEKDDHGFAVTDESLSDLTTGNWRRPQWTYEMFVMNTTSKELRRIHTTPFNYIPARLNLWISPDGRYAVTEQPALEVQSVWMNYDEPYLKRNTNELKGNVFKVRKWAGLPQIMLVNTETGELTPLIDAPLSNHQFLSAVWDADSKSVIVQGSFLPFNTDDKTELAQRAKSPVIAEVALPSRSVRRIIDLPNNEYWVTRSGKTPHSFSVDRWKLEDGDLMRSIPPLEFQRERSEWKQRAESVGSAAFSDIAIDQAIDRWPRLTRTDAITQHKTILLDPNQQLRTATFGREEFIHWKGKRGEPLVGGLTYPTDYRAGVRYPLVIQTHGFSEDSFLPDGPFTTAFAAQELANRGVAILQLGESPLYDQTKGTLDWGPAQLSQVESAIDYLDTRGVIDREKIGLVGFSITGYIVRFALENSTYKFAVATSAEGNDYGYCAYVFGANTPNWASQNEAPYGGPPWKGNLTAWVENSVSFHYDKINAPLRLESDSNDFGLVLNEWENYIALKRLHKPVELIYVPHGDHPVVKPWDRLTSQQGNVDWLLFWLKGEEDPDPSKTDQYARWRQLKQLQNQDLARSPMQ
jgi:hypothetical protein